MLFRVRGPFPKNSGACTYLTYLELFVGQCCLGFKKLLGIVFTLDISLGLVSVLA